MQGWVKLHRCLMEKAIFDNPKLLKVFMWCLFKATHKQRDLFFGTRKITLEPGQFVTGRFSASEELNMNGSTVWRYLHTLKDNETIEIIANNKYTLINVVNWANYQVADDESEQQMNIKRTSNEHQMNTNKNVKNDKNEKNKREYAPAVKMTDEEHNKLIEKFGQRDTNDRIERLSLYKKSTGKKYKCDYSTILAWARKDEPARRTLTSDDVERKRQEKLRALEG